MATAATSYLFERYLERARRRVDKALDARLPRAAEEPRRLHAAIRYSVFAGGKRLRPALCLLACESVSGSSAPALPAAAALEMIHAFSLIHDDLPGMDDDDWRRGQPSNHKVFGEGMAILAGDALLALGFETLAKGPLGRARDPGALLRLVTEATGTGGMIGGQAMDLLSEGKRLSLRRVLASLSRTQRLGASVTGALRTVADDLRGERRTLAEERARRAPVKMLFPLVFLILPAFLLLTVGPVVLATIRSLR